MRIKINYLARIEGHAGFISHLFNGNIKKAKIEVHEGARLIEGLLAGRNFSDAPIINARICGVCPVVHSLTSIKAIEKALSIKVKPEVIVLRKLMLAAQMIHSHTLHLFFLSLPDFLNYADDLAQIKKHPKQTQEALELRNFGNKIIEIVSARAVHPIAAEVGGFKRYPSKSELKKLYQWSLEILPKAINLANFFKRLDYPAFNRQMTFISLYNPDEYAVYGGQIKIQNSGTEIKSADKFYQSIQEFEEKGEVVKRVKYNQQSYMLGALARINNNAGQLNKEAKKVLGELIKKRPINNTFYNIFAQAVEVIHFVEECQKLLKKLDSMQLDSGKNVKIKIKAGIGLGISEAPRGILIHRYEIEKNGRFRKCNIITPTAQFLNNIEEDLKIWLPKVRNLSPKERERKIKMLIRAYDPCISCATH